MDAVITQLTTNKSQAPLQKIGQGFCGTVWAGAENQAGHHIALKREDGGPSRSVCYEHRIHEHLLEKLRPSLGNAFGEPTADAVSFRVSIPFCHGLLDNASPHWARILPRLPPGSEPCNALMNERIPSLPLRVRKLLTEKYQPEGRGSALDIANEPCLVRSYLGRRRYRQQGTRPSRLLFFSLRNFPLHLDQMEELGLPTEQYANAMADALAFLHWTAKVDGNDVEFVLAPSGPTAEPRWGIGSIHFESEALGSHVIWMLDFDCCRTMSMDQAGVKQAVASFLRNDPYYPRPGRTNATDGALWNHFRTRFLTTSRYILMGQEESVQQLSQMLMEEIERLCRGAPTVV